MARFWIGVALLAAFLGLGFFTSMAMENVHMPISQTLKEAAEAAMAGDTEQGVALAGQAEQAWQANWRATAAVADHGGMDDINGLFAQTGVYARQGMWEEFAAYCVRLSEHIHAIGEAHGFYWWSLL